MASPSIRRIERLNYLLGGALVIAAALTQPRPIALGFAVGIGLTCLNFFVLRKLVTKWTADAARGVNGRGQLLVIPKMIGLLGAVIAALALLPIDPIAFTAGYSLFVVSIVIETVHSALRSDAAPEAPSEPDGQPHG